MWEPIKEFLKPSLRKVGLSMLIFLFLFTFGTPLCIDPSMEGWQQHPDSEYWGCHSMWHRYFHSIPDWPVISPVPFLDFVIISYFLSCLIVWIYNKVKKK
jgi:hypothetical protein